MGHYFDLAWRWIGTTLCYLLFGIGGFFLTLVVFPLLLLLPGDKLIRQKRVRLVIHRSFRLYIEFMRMLRLLDYEIQGAVRLSKARLILANHPSLIDVVFLIAFIQNANCIVKGALLRNLFTRIPVIWAGYIQNNRGPEHVVAAAANALDSGDALIIFPEGTRTTHGKALSLKRGAANIAVRTGVDLTPVIIECSPPTLSKEGMWCQIPATRAQFKITVKPKIGVRPFTVKLVPAKGARLLTEHLRQYFTNELTRDKQPAS